MESKARKALVSLTLTDGTKIGSRVINIQSANLATYFNNGKFYRIHMDQSGSMQGTIIEEIPLPGSDLIVSQINQKGKTRP